MAAHSSNSRSLYSLRFSNEMSSCNNTFPRERSTLASPRSLVTIPNAPNGYPCCSGTGFDVALKLIMAIMAELEIGGVPQAGMFRNRCVEKRTDNDLITRIFTVDGRNRLWPTDAAEHPTREARSLLRRLGLLRRHAVSRSFLPSMTLPLVKRAITLAQRSRNRKGATIDNSDHGSNFKLHLLGIQGEPGHLGPRTLAGRRRSLLRQRDHGAILGAHAD